MGVSHRIHSTPSTGRTGTQKRIVPTAPHPPRHSQHTPPSPPHSLSLTCSAGSPAPLHARKAMNSSSSSPFAGSLHHPSAHIQIILNLLLSPALPQLQEHRDPALQKHRSPQTMQRGSQHLHGFASALSHQRCGQVAVSITVSMCWEWTSLCCLLPLH